MPPSDFIKFIRPGVKIEHLGRSETLEFQEEWQWSPSSMFFQAANVAFAEHYPFGLRPEVLMFLVTHTVAETVRRYPDAYRHLFTRSPAKEIIEVRHDGLCRGNPESPWGEVLPMLNAGLREKVPAGIMEHLLPGFSTATPESDAASMVSFMDAASPFYDYRVMTMCGIPEIRMFGTADDWRKLKTAAAMLAEPFSRHLGLYFRHLLPVLATLAAQADGASQDDAFWKSIYKFESRSGGDEFGGWLSAFVNYVTTPTGELVQKDEKLFDWTRDINRERGLSVGCVPSHVACVPFVWDIGTEVPMAFMGGMLAADDEGGYLTPALSYAVIEG